MDQELNRVAQSKLKTAYSPKRRQTIISGRKGKTYADFIEPLSGLNARAFADSNNPIIASFADGFNVDGQVDHINRITSNVNFENLTPNATNYLGIERVDSNTVSPVITTTKPTYDSIFGSDRENKICATFDGTLTSTNFKDFYDNIFRLYNGASIQTGHPSGSGNSLRINGGTQYGEVDLLREGINIASLNEWTIEFYWKLDTINNGTNQFFVSGTYANFLDIYKPANTTEITFNIGDGGGYNIISAGTLTVPAMSSNTWYKFTLVFSHRKIKAYHNSTLYFTSGVLSPELRIGALNKLLLGTRYGFVQPMTGNISNFAFWPYAKYHAQGGTQYGNVNGTSTIYPAISTANLTVDAVIEDRYFKKNDRFHIDLQDVVNGQQSFKETYGNQIGFPSSTTGTVQPYILTGVTGPSGFGNVNVLRTSSVATIPIAIAGIVLPDRWTLETWVYPITGTGDRTIFTFHDQAYGQYPLQVRFNTTDNIVMIASSTSGDTIFNLTSAGTYPENNWYHIAFSYDGSTYRLFVNGTQILSSNSILPIYNPGRILFGGISTGEALEANYFAPTFTPYCKYNSGFTPPTSLTSFKEDVYYYDINKAKMYKGYYNNWSEVKTIFLGQAFTNASSIEKIFTYSLNGECFIDDIDSYSDGLAGNNTIYLVMYLPHFIGTDRVNVDYWFIFNQIQRIDLSANAAFKFNSKTKPMAILSSGTSEYTSDPIYINDEYVILFFGGSGWIINTPLGGAISITTSSNYGKWQFKIERDF